MVDRLIVDLFSDGAVAVSAHRDGDDLPDTGPRFEFAWPLDEDALDELRWYLEDYLRLPAAVYGERGQRIQGRLAAWGTALFGAVFGTGPARDAYQRLRARAVGTRLVVRSADPRLLALPWELMRDPDRPAPLALDLAGVSRSLPAGQLPDTVPVPGGRLRVLIVIARPEGEADVGYQMIARPLLERLHAVRGEVDLVVLRPPTLDALERALRQASAEGAPYHVVHFDGHGRQNDRWFPAHGPRDAFGGRPGEGVLVFEKPGGGADPVPASALARVLAEAKVPVVVLNACQSGAVGKDLEAAIATRLLAEGTASVVAMAYSVYAVAAAEFMAEFYERLFAGDPVSAAVTAGRKRMATRSGRPSRKGDMPLDDWLIPVHYLRRDVCFPQAVTPRAGPLSLDEQLDQISAATRAQGSGDLDPVGSFVGRDWMLCQLETVARVQKVVVLHGPGGTGKTELAKAFGRWWRDTGGVENPEWVFFHSFEPGDATSGLDGAINEIGRGLFRTGRFDRLEPGQRREAVEKFLTEHRVLLIWDNFETVYSMPECGLSDEGVFGFLNRLANRGKSAVLITSRSPEPWLGDIRRLPVAGLTPLEADQYATSLLEPYTAARARRRKPAFADLMEWLDGHPLSMRLILPHLETTSPEALLDALRGATPLPGTAEEGSGRLTSLPASIGYSYTHLSAQTRRLLPAICLVQSVADAYLFTVFSQVDEVPERFCGATTQNWDDALNEAASVGLLSPIGAGCYRIHPALPAYLAALWRAAEQAHYGTIRDAATRAVTSACAALGAGLRSEIDSGDTGLAYRMIGLQRRTLGSMLGYALAHGYWDEALAMYSPLQSYLDRRVLTEADEWADQIVLAVASSSAPPADFTSAALQLWLEVTLGQAVRRIGTFRLDQAERTVDLIRARLAVLPPSQLRQRYLHILSGLVRSIGSYRSIGSHRSRASETGDEHGEPPPDNEEGRGRARENYFALGLAAAERGLPDEAEHWYQQAFATSTERGDKSAMASTLVQLGDTAQQQGRPDDAEERWLRALSIYVELDDRPGMAFTYHLLGSLALARDKFDDAEEWYRESLDLREQIGDKHGIAFTCEGLGLLALHRGQPGEAEDWQRKALASYAELGDTNGEARVRKFLSTLTEMRDDDD